MFIENIPKGEGAKRKGRKGTYLASGPEVDSHFTQPRQSPIVPVQDQTSLLRPFKDGTLMGFRIIV